MVNGDTYYSFSKRTRLVFHCKNKILDFEKQFVVRQKIKSLLIVNLIFSELHNVQLNYASDAVVLIYLRVWLRLCVRKIKRALELILWPTGIKRWYFRVRRLTIFPALMTYGGSSYTKISSKYPIFCKKYTHSQAKNKTISLRKSTSKWAIFQNRPRSGG